MTIFKIGDKVRVNTSGTSEYSITKEGSEGIVLEISKVNCSVKFYKTTGELKVLSEKPIIFVIDNESLDLIEPGKEIDTKEYLRMKMKRIGLCNDLQIRR